MNNVTIPVTTLETLIEGLESAINVCYNVDSNDSNSEKTYPYAVGYSRATMREVIDQLKTLKVQRY
jgi:hypothetical protein